RCTSILIRLLPLPYAPLLLFSLSRPLPPSTLFPYTTLFRSDIRMMSTLSVLLCQHPQILLVIHAFISRHLILYRIFHSQPDHLSDRKSTRLNSSHVSISYAVFCLKKKKKHTTSASSTTLHNT